MATKKDEQQSPAPPVINDDTMTSYGMTVGDIVADRDTMQRSLNAAQQIIDAHAAQDAARGRQIAALENAVAEKDATIQAQMARLQELEAAAAVNAETIAELSKPKPAPTPEQLGAAMASAGLGNSAGLQRLANGGLRVMVEVDVDTATPLLSWAESAGEDPVTYIQRQVSDALVAVTSS